MAALSALPSGLSTRTRKAVRAMQMDTGATMPAWQGVGGAQETLNYD